MTTSKTAAKQRKKKQPTRQEVNLDNHPEQSGPEPKEIQPKPTILEFDTSAGLPERLKIQIDGQMYPLRRMEEFSFPERLRIGRNSAKLAKVGSVEGLVSMTDQEIEEAEVALDKVLGKILMAPAPVIALLRSDQKLQVMGVFSEAARQTGKLPSPHSTSSFQPSSGSTEETGERG